MSTKRFLVTALSLASLLVGTSNAMAQIAKTETAAAAEDLSTFKAAVEANPSSIEAHQAYIKATGFTKRDATENPELAKQYAAWMKQFPQNAIVPFALGEAYYQKELPSAKPYLLKALELDPKMAKAYFYLWIDAERWGDFAGGRDYLAKAIKADPTNPDYNFYYASSFSSVDPDKYRSLSLEVAKKFPASERGAQALYWLGARFTDTKERIGYYELLKNSYAPDKFSWSSSGMSGYFDLLLTVAPEKALELARSMEQTMTKEEQKKSWAEQAATAQNIVRAQLLLAEKKPGEAVAILEKTRVSRWSTSKLYVEMLKASALDASGKTAVAYDNLKLYYAKEPVKELEKALKAYGAKLGKNQGQVESDVWYVRDTAARQATPFELKRYLTTGMLSLADLKGKVVLLTYWFPGCGPCRGEFPHFEDVVRKFKGKNLEYVGINIAPEQNDYVVPFMKSSGYSFTPIEEVPGRVKGNLDNRNAAPVNFLLDQEGRIMFSNFRTDEHNEDVLEAMISSLMNRKAGKNTESNMRSF